MAIQRDFIVNRGLVVNTALTVGGIDVLANDYSTYTTLTANIYNTFVSLNANIGSGQGNVSLIYANDYNTYTTLVNEYSANDFSTFTSLQSGYRANDFATWSGLTSAIDIKANSSVNIIAGSGIAGGGPITGNVNISVDSSVVRTSGNQSISGQKTFADSVIISGDLTVDGNVVSVNSTSLVVEDRFIQLGSNNTGVPVGDVGVYLNRGTSGNSAIYYDESAGYFALAHTADPATNTVVSPTSFGFLRVDTILVSNNSVVTNLNSDLLDGQSGAYYVDFANATNTNLITLARVTANGNSTTDHVTVGGLTVDSNTLHVDSTNNFVGIRTLAPRASLQIREAGLETSTLVTTTTTADQVVDSFSASTFRTAKYIVQIHDTLNNHYQTSEILLIHDGTTVYTTEYAIVYTNSSLATFGADIVGGNVRLLVTPTNTNNTIKTFRSCING